MSGVPISLGFSAIRIILSSSQPRALIRKGLEKCGKCGKRPIDIFFDECLGIKQKKCITCASIVSALKFFTFITLKALNTNRDALVKALSVSYWRKGLTSTIKGLAWFGATKPFVTGAPLFVVWNFTNRCNLRCKHCYQNASASLPTELTTSEALHVVKELSDADVTSIAFSGGEPLVRQDFFEVASSARDNGMYVTIASNGTLITKDVAKKLAKTVHYAEISLDSINPKTHDEFRGILGSWDRAVSAIKYLTEEGVTVGVATTVTKHNILEIQKMIDFIEGLGADYFICFNFIPTGRATEILEEDPTPQEREELMRYLYRRLVFNMIQNKKLKIYTTAPQFARVGLETREEIINEICAANPTAPCVEPVIPTTHYTNIPGITPEVAEFIGGCGAGRVYAAISPEGDVQPCVFMPIKLGNLRHESFEKIWLSSRVLNDLRDRNRLKGGCGVCSYKLICGGCRARAYGYFGDYLMSDPGCIRRIYEKSLHMLQLQTVKH
ncbi:MAG: radical SAM protein [Nitrososphaerota archaeon]|nr:radical SAM protein [Aigarchaeota archaeon]MDW8076320.1 radical SAM protein [Nitrososphaerota archaeon]